MYFFGLENFVKYIADMGWLLMQLIQSWMSEWNDLDKVETLKDNMFFSDLKSCKIHWWSGLLFTQMFQSWMKWVSYVEKMKNETQDMLEIL